MLVETGKNTFCLSLDTGKQSGTFQPLHRGGMEWVYFLELHNITMMIYMYMYQAVYILLYM